MKYIFKILLLSLITLWGSSLFAATFVVDATTDGWDVTPGDGVCDDGTGVCTLRAAIGETNAWP